jgi:hypothetical protein
MGKFIEEEDDEMKLPADEEKLTVHSSDNNIKVKLKKNIFNL